MGKARDLSDKERARLAHILISKYLTLYIKNHKIKPIINRYSAKWGMMDVIDSVGAERANELLEFYFQTKHAQHDLEYFYKNFDKMDANEKALREDRARRARIMRQSRDRVREAEDQ